MSSIIRIVLYERKKARETSFPGKCVLITRCNRFVNMCIVKMKRKREQQFTLRISHKFERLVPAHVTRGDCSIIRETTIKNVFTEGLNCCYIIILSFIN